jgi:alpha-L-rhamnosidase
VRKPLSDAIAIVASLVALVASVSSAPAATVHDLRTESLARPVGIDAAHPDLSWRIDAARRGYRQSAYQVLVASSPGLLRANQGDLWDSGKVASAESVHVPYAGAALESRADYYWKVRVWDTRGQVSAWSAPASWRMALLTAQDWTAQWITASRWYTRPSMRAPGLIVAPGGWADVDLGEERPIDSIELYFADLKRAPKRFKILGANDLEFASPTVLVDRSAADYQPEGRLQEFAVHGVSVRRLRLWVIDPTAADGGIDRTVLTAPMDPAPLGTAAIRQLQVFSRGRNVALMRPTRERGTQWNEGHAAAMVDGMPSANDGDEVPADACPVETAPLMRKAFTVSQPVRRATLYVAALGTADVTVNGRRVTDAVLGPPFTDYTKRVAYVTRDVSTLVKQGANVIGVTLGNGFFSPPMRGFGERHGGHGPPRVLLQTEIELADGSRQVIDTDESWTWSRSDIVYNDVFAGYVENREDAHPGWDTAGFDASAWKSVAVTSSLGGKLVASTGPPIRVMGELRADRVQGNHAYFKTLSTGWPQVKIIGHAGQRITLLGHSSSYDAPPLTFVLTADGPTVLQPRFMYLSGPLDLEVQGNLESLGRDDAKILLVHADLERSSSFESSNAWLNELYDVDSRTQSNYVGDQPMDPMREKQGWTQDAQNMFETAAYLTNVSQLYRKWWQDFADNQDESGYVGSIAPLVGRQAYDWNSPWWSGAIVLLPWQHYQFYGDRRILEESYAAMRRYVDFLGQLNASGSVRSWGDYPYLNLGRGAAGSTDAKSNEAQPHLLSWLGAGDWMNPFGGHEAVPAPLLDMPAWIYYAGIVSRSAAILGNVEDAERYATLAAALKSGFNATFLNAASGLYGNQPDVETTQALPLALDIVPSDSRAPTHERLLEAIHARHDHQGTGFVGLPWLLHVLIDFRDTALANRIVNQRDFPSWNTLMHDGVFAENWHGTEAQMPSCGGAIGMWLHQAVLGIRPDPAGPGFEKFFIAPQPDVATALTWARGSYMSGYGQIISDWKIGAGKFTLRAVVPANTTATIVIPNTRAETVMESGKPAAASDGVTFLRQDGDTAVFAVGAGEYAFTAEWRSK